MYVLYIILFLSHFFFYPGQGHRGAFPAVISRGRVQHGQITRLSQPCTFTLTAGVRPKSLFESKKLQSNDIKVSKNIYIFIHFKCLKLFLSLAKETLEHY